MSGLPHPSFGRYEDPRHLVACTNRCVRIRSARDVPSRTASHRRHVMVTGRQLNRTTRPTLAYDSNQIGCISAALSYRSPGLLTYSTALVLMMTG